MDHVGGLHTLFYPVGVGVRSGSAGLVLTDILIGLENTFADCYYGLDNQVAHHESYK